MDNRVALCTLCTFEGTFDECQMYVEGGVCPVCTESFMVEQENTFKVTPYQRQGQVDNGPGEASDA